MGKLNKKMSNSVYDRMIPHLAEKDGLTHVIMINSFSKMRIGYFDCDQKYTDEIDNLIYSMQRDGYQIVDVKFNSIPNRGTFGSRTGFNTLIVYK